MTRTNGLPGFSWWSPSERWRLLALPAVAGAKDRNHDRIPDRGRSAITSSLDRSQAGRDRIAITFAIAAKFMAGDNPRMPTPTTTGSRTATRTPGRSSRSTSKPAS